ncbi:hypothetical protein [Longimicrobium sp.]|uniref:hypothetical protein n=1 Tax=Longimicrobium sp. TaxID=2029185 RepID=UPI002CC2DD90|nr:hypothetical protein [Longimicrobium sp.]HSU17514.1 hypothetical protein [Longimicrobium sp.]
MPSQFRPAPQDVIDLFGEPWTVQPHPAVAIKAAYAQEGGRALVYQLRDTRGRPMALKVFKSRFREPSLAESGSRLAWLQPLEGLTAAKRQVVLPSEAAVRRFPDLEYALMMPWLEGATWQETLVQANQHGATLPFAGAVHLCEAFLRVMAQLEGRGVAHTDIACGNVVVHVDSPAVQLLDLEDMYLPGSPAPGPKRAGSPDYRHRARQSVFCAEGDRFATALLAAEILLLAEPTFTPLASDTGMFGSPDDGSADQRYAETRPWLAHAAPEFAEVFARAWSAPSLQECPTVSDLHNAVVPLAKRTGPVAPPPDNEHVIWRKPGTGHRSEPGRRTGPSPTPPPQGNGSVIWSAVGQPPAQPTPLSPPARPRPAIPIWTIIVAALILAVLLFLVI